MGKMRRVLTVILLLIVSLMIFGCSDMNSINSAPEVSAGPQITVQSGEEIELQGIVSDDGLPLDSDLEITWTKVSGPDDFEITEVNNPISKATFNEPGEYVLQLSAYDGESEDSQTVKIIVQDENSQVLKTQKESSTQANNNIGVEGTICGVDIGDGCTDNLGSGEIYASSGDANCEDISPKYDLCVKCDDNYVWSNHDCVQKQTCSSAYNCGGATPYCISGSCSGSCPTDSSCNAYFGYDQEADNGICEDNQCKGIEGTICGIDEECSTGFECQSSKCVKKEIVCGVDIGDGCSSFSKSNTQTPISEGDTWCALNDDMTPYCVACTAGSSWNYETERCVTENQAPIVNAGPDINVEISKGAILQGSATDDGKPTGKLTYEWSKVSGPGNIIFNNKAIPKPKADFSQIGVYVLRLTVDDGALKAYDELTVTVVPEQSIIGDIIVDYIYGAGNLIAKVTDVKTIPTKVN